MDSRSDWLRARKTGIGGSDAAKLFGVSPWGDELSLYYDKTSEEVSEDDGDVTSPLYWGRLFEPAVRQAYSDRCGRTVMPGAVMARHPEFPFIVANTDGLILDEIGTDHGVFEGKMTVIFRESDWADESTPLYYRIQVQHYMAVLGLQWAVVACLVLGRYDPLIYRDIPRNDQFVDLLLEKERRFWNDHVLPQKPPRPTGKDASTRTLAKMFARDNGRVTFLPPAAKGWVSDLSEVDARISDLTVKREQIRNNLRFEIGDASFGIIDDGGDPIAFSHHEQTRPEHIVKASSFRVLRKLSTKRTKALIEAEKKAIRAMAAEDEWDGKL